MESSNINAREKNKLELRKIKVQSELKNRLYNRMMNSSINSNKQHEIDLESLGDLNTIIGQETEFINLTSHTKYVLKAATCSNELLLHAIFCLRKRLIDVNN